MRPYGSFTLLALLAQSLGILVGSLAAEDDGPMAVFPAAWRTAWERPPAADRPLQILHRIDPERVLPDGVLQSRRGGEPGRPEPKGMQYYKDLGLGGAVTNVAFQDYLTSEPNWKTFVAGVDALARLGMIVWLYDEKGYPSGAAGGLVLQDNPAFEAMELAWDASRTDPFLFRAAYEHTHASNNYFAARRYINLLDDRAVRAFIAKTHEAYRQRLGAHFGRTIQAMFTDEPSLIAVNLGQIPEPARKAVPVVDPIDPAARPLPAIPWCYDLAERYRQRYGTDLNARCRSLFCGDAPEDRHVRRQFWALVADLVAERYFGALQTWCARAGIASSGHTLWEESLMHHVPLEGNGLKVLGRMDIPGLDVLSSDPAMVVQNGWMTAGLPMSAAILNGRRRVMTEVSDFSQKMSGAGPVPLAEMQATAAWQAAWGVTEFTLYYSIADRTPQTYRAYCDYVGRLNAMLKPARPAPTTLLYYPIYDLWAEYRPVAEPMRLESQSPRAQRIVHSFMRLGRALVRSQIPFALIDHEYLAASEVQPGGVLAIKDQRFRSLVLPEDVELAPGAAAVVERFGKAGGRVIADPTSAKQTGPTLLDALRPEYRLSPASEQIVLGQFLRDDRPILLLANVGPAAYSGQISADTARPWLMLDPASGAIKLAEGSQGQIRLALAARQAVLLLRTP